MGKNRSRKVSTLPRSPIVRKPLVGLKFNLVEPYMKIMNELRVAFPGATHALIHMYRSSRTSSYLKAFQLNNIDDKWILASYWGVIDYLGAQGSITTIPDQFNMHETDPLTTYFPDAKTITLPDGMNFVLAAPCSDTSESEVRARAILRAAAGAIGAACGDHLVEDFQAENLYIINAPGDAIDRIASFESDLTPGIANIQGDYDKQHLDELMQIEKAIESETAIKYQRALRLSLRLFHRSAQGDLADRFLFRYMALEAIASSLGLTGTGQSAPAICNLMANAYGITQAEAKQRFYIGKLYGLRSNIAHGNTDEVNRTQLSLVRAVYRDCLFERLGLKPPNSAGVMLSAIGNVQILEDRSYWPKKDV